MKRGHRSTAAPDLSLLVPVYDEEGALPELVRRIRETAERAGWSWELICVLDGCTDRSAEVLRGAGCPELRVIELDRNRGQHTALFAGLEAARGRIVAMLDADLQNPPEELPAFVAGIEAGADAVVGWRRGRQDALWRNVVSRGFNLAMGLLLAHPGRDLGCMLRAYRREVVDAFLASGEAPLFLPVQLGRWVGRMEERAVAHAPREHGSSRYSPLRLARLLAQVVRSRFAPPRQGPGKPPPYRTKSGPDRTGRS